MQEEWKTIEGYDYMVSNLGRIKYLKNGHTTKGYPNRKGHLMCALQLEEGRKQFRIYKLVAEAFIPNPENKKEVVHLDMNKRNNDISNLVWMTEQEKYEYINRIGDKRQQQYRKEKTLKILCVEKNRVYDSISDAAYRLNIKKKFIKAVLRQVQRTAGGYRFEFYEEKDEK